jgi:hypothetical protein
VGSLAQTRKGHSAASRNQGKAATDFTDDTDGPESFRRIRETREIRGKKSPEKCANHKPGGVRTAKYEYAEKESAEIPPRSAFAYSAWSAVHPFNILFAFPQKRGNMELVWRSRACSLKLRRADMEDPPSPRRSGAARE